MSGVKVIREQGQRMVVLPRDVWLDRNGMEVTSDTQQRFQLLGRRGQHITEDAARRAGVAIECEAAIAKPVPLPVREGFRRKPPFVTTAGFALHGDE